MKNRPSGAFRQAVGLLRPFWKLAALAAACGIAGAAATTAVLARINRAIASTDSSPAEMLVPLAALALIALAAEFSVGVCNSLVGQGIIARLRRDLSARILAAPIPLLERLKPHRLLATLNEDLHVISAFTFNFASWTISLAITIGAFAYLATLSRVLFPVALAAMAAIALAQSFVHRYGVARFDVAREGEDDLQRHYLSMISGAKELRLSRPRRARLYGRDLAATIELIRERFIAAVRVYQAMKSSTAALFFIAIGFVLYMSRSLGDASAAGGFVLVLVYLKGPVDHIVGALPLFAQAQVSFRKVAQLTEALAGEHADLELVDAPAPDGGFETIELREATYAFPEQEGRVPFELGPIDLVVRRGEILFVTGENGCGKTTLIKLLLGLYEPTSGRLLRDGAPVPRARRDDYRQLFSAVFFDYHLFGDLLVDEPGAVDRARGYLERLQLAGAVGLSEGAFSTLDVSTGQRKRLALIQVYLEGRPIVVFDEWAAEQDPTFRRVFYTELLPDLKAQGKTLIVISHDDRYFAVADHRIRVERGRIVERFAAREA